jgi:hypothetical protein
VADSQDANDDRAGLDLLIRGLGTNMSLFGPARRKLRPMGQHDQQLPLWKPAREFAPDTADWSGRSSGPRGDLEWSAGPCRNAVGCRRGSGRARRCHWRRGLGRLLGALQRAAHAGLHSGRRFDEIDQGLPKQVIRKRAKA